MDDILRWLANWRGIEPEPGSELRFEFSSFPSGGLGLLVLLGIAVAIGLVLLIYRRDGKNLTWAQRAMLALLRTLAVLAVIALLLEPSLVSVKRETRPGHTLLLVDSSQSMTHVDAFRREAVQPLAAGWRSLGVREPAGATRLDLLKALLQHGDGDLLRKLAKNNQLLAYTFAGSLDQLPLLPPPPPPTGPDGQPVPPPPDAPPPLPRLDVAKLVADGRASNPGGALRTALDKSRGAEIAAVVFVTDGRRNAGPQGAEIARLLNQRKIPHTFVLGIGDPSETQTVQLSRFDAPAKVFQKEPFELKSTIVQQGYEPMLVTARLVRIDDKGQEQLVKTQQVQIGGDRNEVDVEWKQITSDAPGRFLYRAELQPPDGEAVVAERHAKSAPIEVLTERLRLLLIAGGANHEFQILRNLLIRDKTIDVSCWLQSADEKFPQDGDENVRIDRLPEARTDFDPYDVIVLIDPDASKLTPRFCQHLQQHVVEGGAGLWWAAGEKYSLEAMSKTAATFALAEMLPIVPDLEVADRNLGLGKVFARENRIRLSAGGDGGIGAKITRLADGRDENRLLWDKKLPGTFFWFPVLELKPVAASLVEYSSSDMRRGGVGMPVVALQNVGAGRVLFSGTDETHRWRGKFEQAYNRFWVNGVRWLFEGRVQAGNSRLRLSVSDEKLDLGDAIELTAEVRDEALQPLVAAAFPVSLERDGASEVLPLPAVEGALGRFAQRFRPTQLGTYRVRPVETIGKGAEATFQVVAATVERQGPMDRAELAAIAAAIGGELCETPQALLAAVDRIPSRSTTDTFRSGHALWDGWPTIAFVVTVLAIEWLLRKRFNLL